LIEAAHVVPSPRAFDHAGTERAARVFEEAKRQKSWGMYSYATLRLLLPELRHDLRGVLRGYAHNGHHADLVPARPRYEGGATHLVVHYRLGDFVGLGYAARSQSPTWGGHSWLLEATAGCQRLIRLRWTIQVRPQLATRG